jgi:hypothetical protein
MKAMATAVDYKRGFRRIQLRFLGFIAICIGPLSAFFGCVVHKLPMLQSISEGGTVANKISPILPYCLGALSLFALSYALTVA